MPGPPGRLLWLSYLQRLLVLWSRLCPCRAGALCWARCKEPQTPASTLGVQLGDKSRQQKNHGPKGIGSNRGVDLRGPASGALDPGPAPCHSPPLMRGSIWTGHGAGSRLDLGGGQEGRLAVARTPGFESPLPLNSWGAWAGPFTSLSLSFFTCKVGGGARLARWVRKMEAMSHLKRAADMPHMGNTPQTSKTWDRKQVKIAHWEFLSMGFTWEK